MSSERNDQGEKIEHPSSLQDRMFEEGKKAKSLFSDARIHRVPKDLRELNESAYTPRLIAIGPLHRDDHHLPKTMQLVKMNYAHYLFFRVAEHQWNNVLEKCEKKMKEKKCVDRAKKYYAEEVKVKDDDEMAEMMLVDGCFILELLYASYHDIKTKEAGKSTTKGGDSGNSKASSSSVPQPIDEGEGGSTGCIYSFCKRRSSVPQPTNEGEGDSSEQPNADPIFGSILTAEIVKHDLLLLENQIPFFVLEELFKLTVEKIQGEKKLSLPEYVVSYFGDIMSPEGENSGSKTKTGCCNSPSDRVLWDCGGSTKENEQEKEVSGKASETKTSCCNSLSDCVLWVRGCTTKENEQEKKVPGRNANKGKPYHILHLVHQHYLPGKKNEPSGGKTTLEVCASALDYAGVKFVPVEDKNLFAVNFRERNCLSWWFRRARFEIPALHIHDPTKPFLRNLIALEQCCPGVSLHFTSYAKLMDKLINSKEDVQVLQKAKVIHNYLGSEEDVTELFNNLCKEVVLGQFYFNDVCVKAFNYGKHWWPQSRAYVTRRFFSSPWAFISVILGLATFVIQITTFVRSFRK